MEQEWLGVNAALRNYIEHPEAHTAIIFLRSPLLSQETLDRLREDKGIIMSDRMGDYYMVQRIPGNPYDRLAKKPE